MKKMKITGLIMLLFTGLLLNAAEADKTIANLRAAFKGESTASAKYAAFAAQAKKEGLSQIASMFEATSKAEAIHAQNHKTVVEKMGQKMEPVKPEFTVKTTKENLEDAIEGETYEFTKMYPEFIASAKAENAAPASKSFSWAMDTEKEHQKIYQKALQALIAKKSESLSGTYWVCPKCGNTLAEAKVSKDCAFCSTGKDRFIKFGK